MHFFKFYTDSTKTSFIPSILGGQSAKLAFICTNVPFCVFLHVLLCSILERISHETVVIDCFCDFGGGRASGNWYLLNRLKKRVAASEHRHSGEIRICVEAGLPTSYLWRHFWHKVSVHAIMRQRAVMMRYFELKAGEKNPNELPNTAFFT
jgi:hypothetical protein